MVSKAIDEDDQTAATEEKTKLEEAQRAGARERKALGADWIPKHFELVRKTCTLFCRTHYLPCILLRSQNPATDQYEYKHADLRPWDPLNDLYQYERDFVICTRTRHKTPMIRTQSIVSVSDAAKTPGGGDVADGGASAGAAGDRPSSSSIRGMKETSSVRRRKFKSGSSSPGKGAQQKVSPSRAKAAPGGGGHESGSTIPEESDGGGVVTSSSRYRKDFIFLLHSFFC